MKSIGFKALFLSLLLVLPINNYLKYNPTWGYDGPGHMSLIETVARQHTWPTHGYASSNPPLYYYVSAMLLRITDSFKAVQFLSLLGYLLCIFLFYKVAGLYTRKWSVQYAFTAFFSLLPFTLNYAFMVFNYSLGHTFSLAAISALLYMVTTRRITLLSVSMLGLIVGLGVLTSLTNLSMIVVITGSILLFPCLSLRKKASLLAIFLVITGLIILPHYNYKVKNYGDFLSAPNKGAKTNKKLTETYPLRYFYTINMDMFEKPYAFNYLCESFWIRLHQTTYSDYWNYLVNERLSPFNEGENEPLVAEGKMFKTNPHYIDAERIKNLKALNYLGIPISLLLLVCFMVGAHKVFLQLKMHDSDYIAGFVLILTVVTFFVQFLCYIFNYPYFQCIHAGYTMPAYFAALIITIKNIGEKKWVVLVLAYLLLFALRSFATFIA